MALLSAGCGGTAQKSPSGNIRAEVFAGKEGLYYTVTHDGRTVIDTSAMGVTVDGTELFRDAALRPAGTRKIDETYSVTGRKAVSEGRCNEYLFDVTHRPSGYKYRLQTRLYDDGFAYRFVLPGDGTRTVNGEAAQWRPPHQSRVWFAERNSGWKLLTYAGEWISTTADSLHIVSRQGPVQTMPLLYRPPRRIRDDSRSRAVRLQRHAFARGTRSQPAGRLHRTGGIRAIRRHRHPVARHDHRPRPRRTGKYRHHHQSQPGSRPGTVRRHVVDRPRTLAVELVERHRRRLHDPRRRKAGDRHRSIAGHRV